MGYSEFFNRLEESGYTDGGYIYFVCIKDDLFKVGVSINPPQRVKTLKASSTILITKKIKLSSVAEQNILKEMYQNKMRVAYPKKEHFYMDTNDIEFTISTILKYEKLHAF